MELGPRLLAALLVFVVFLLIAAVIRRIVRATMSRVSTEGHVDLLVAQLSYVGTLVVGGVVALSAVVNVAALVTSLGLLGFTLGFAVKDIVGNFLSGIIILVQRPFTLGDSISVNGVEGVVEEIRVRATVLRTPDEDLVYVPNSTIFSNSITNRSAFTLRPVKASVTVAPGADLAVALAAMKQAAQRVDGALKQPEAESTVSAITDTAIQLEVKFWVDTHITPVALARSRAFASIKEALEHAEVRLGGGS